MMHGEQVQGKLTGEELFGALVRSWGVFVTLYGVYDLAYQAIKLLGLFLLKGADLVVRFAYGRSSGHEPST